MSNLTQKSQPPQAVLDQIIGLYNQGQLEQTVSVAENLAKQYPDALILYDILGAAYMGLKNTEKTIASYQKALQLNPNHTDAHNNMGMALYDQGRFNEAVESYQKAVKLEPSFADAHYNLGNALKQTGDLKQAIESYRASIAINPNDAEVLLNYGNALKSFGETYYLSGTDLHKKGDIKSAIKNYKKTLAIIPDHVDALNNLGIAFYNMGDLDMAIDKYNKALQINAGYGPALVNLGNALRDKGQIEVALDCFMKAEDVGNISAELFTNTGNAFMDVGDFDSAINSYNKAISFDPTCADAYFNKSSAYLKMYNFEKGWFNYEHRWKTIGFDTPYLKTTKPLWAPPKVGRILLWSEQGIGDVIMFASIIFDVIPYARKLILQIDQRLIPLLKRSLPQGIQFFSNNEKIPVEYYDYHMPLGSLPGIFRGKLETFTEKSRPYLKADKKLSNQLRGEIQSNASQKICGLSWKGGSKNSSVGNSKSISLRKVASILARKNFKLVNLQYGDTGRELAELKASEGINIFCVEKIDNFQNIDGLAALINSCDHVVTVDNLTTHLAGAIGVATSVLLPFTSSWRWGTSQTESYWHSSLKLYRQEQLSNWSSPLEHLKQDLKDWI